MFVDWSVARTNSEWATNERWPMSCLLVLGWRGRGWVANQWWLPKADLYTKLFVQQAKWWVRAGARRACTNMHASIRARSWFNVYTHTRKTPSTSCRCQHNTVEGQHEWMNEQSNRRTDKTNDERQQTTKTTKTTANGWLAGLLFGAFFPQHKLVFY